MELTHKCPCGTSLKVKFGKEDRSQGEHFIEMFKINHLECSILAKKILSRRADNANSAPIPNEFGKSAAS